VIGLQYALPGSVQPQQRTAAARLLDGAQLVGQYLRKELDHAAYVYRSQRAAQRRLAKRTQGVAGAAAEQ